MIEGPGIDRRPLVRRKGEGRVNPDAIGNLARVSLRNGQTVEEVRPFLDDVIATDTRPEWRKWARDTLGLHPQTDFSRMNFESSARVVGHRI